MKRMNYFGRYLYKWFLLIFSAVVLISIAFNMLSYYRERKSYSEIMVQEQQSRIDYISKTIDNELVKLKITANIILRETAVQELCCKYDFINSHEKNELLDVIINRCLEIDNLNIFVSHSCFYLPEKGIKVDRNGYEFVGEDAYAFAEPSANQEMLICQEGKGYIVEKSRKNYLRGWSKDNILSIFVIELDMGLIQEELKLAKVMEGDILFLTDCQREKILCKTGGDLGAIELGDNGKLELGGKSYVLMQSINDGDFFRLYYLQDQTLFSIMAQRTVTNILVFMVVVVLTIAAAFALFYEKVYQPLEILLVDAFDQIKKSNLSYRIPLPEKESVFANLYRNFNYMAERIDTLVSRELKQKLLINQADFKHLQAQINPHFMYNSYFLLYRMIKDDDKKGSLLVCENLGKFFKYITRDSEDNKSLEEEVSHARSYAVIQQFRYRNIIHMDFPELPKKFGYIEVPRLIIQPLIENVFKYAVSELEDEDEVEVRVSYEETDECLFVCVENSGFIDDERLQEIRGKLIRQEGKEEVTALVNISSRLNLFFNQQQSLTLSKSTLGGLKVCLRLKM